jgi:cystathionine beta-lyase
MKENLGMKKDTIIVNAGRDPESNHGIVNPPVYHASTIIHPTMEKLAYVRDHRWEPGVYSYGRHGTPTHEAFETAVAAVEGGYRCVSTSSGLAAINAAILSFVKAGDHILMVDSAYGPARRFCDAFLKRFGVETTYYDPMIGAGIADLIRDNTKIVYTESPGSHSFEVQDIPAISKAAHDAGAVVIIDNTWSGGVYFQAFEHGVDVSVQAATKYVVGHSDAMMGTITVNEEHWRTVRQQTAEMGAAPGPDDVYLAMRGLRTISVRLQRHYESGLKLAKWLQDRPEVIKVLHPALPGTPGHEFWKRDFTGASGLFSIVLKQCPRDAVAAFIEGLELFGMGASWGGFESLILPSGLESLRTATKWNPGGPTVRLHVGLEDPDDLIADLENGFAKYNAAL